MAFALGDITPIRRASNSSVFFLISELKTDLQSKGSVFFYLLSHYSF